MSDPNRFPIAVPASRSSLNGISSFTDRTSYAPRSSIASTIYGRQAQVQTPAQTGMRAKPTVVSVKSGSGSGANTPPVPSIDFDKYGGGNGRPRSGASAFSVGSTFVNNANTATQARAQQVVKVGTLLNAHTRNTKLENRNGSVINDYVMKETSKRFFNKNRLVGTVRAGLGHFSIYGSYQFTPLFKEGLGPQVHPFSIGLTLSGL